MDGGAVTLDAKRQALSYWHTDGLPTIFGALTYLLACSAFGAVIALSVFGGFALLLLGLPAAAFLLAWFAYHSEDWIEAIKARLTYPRTGYAAPPSQWKKSERDEAADAEYGKWSKIAHFFRTHWLPFFIPLMLFQIVEDAFLHPFHLPMSTKQWSLLALGLFVAMIRTPKLSRDKLFAIEVLGYPVLALAGAYALAKGELIGFVFFLGLAPGLLVLLRGVLTLLRYLRQNPLPPA
jgi:hypothetical protein